MLLSWANRDTLALLSARRHIISTVFNRLCLCVFSSDSLSLVARVKFWICSGFITSLWWGLMVHQLSLCACRGGVLCLCLQHCHFDWCTTVYAWSLGKLLDYPSNYLGLTVLNRLLLLLTFLLLLSQHWNYDPPSSCLVLHYHWFQMIFTVLLSSMCIYAIYISCYMYCTLPQVREGEIGPFQSIKLEVFYTPTIPGEARLKFYIMFSDLSSKPVWHNTVHSSGYNHWN